MLSDMLRLFLGCYIYRVSTAFNRHDTQINEDVYFRFSCKSHSQYKTFWTRQKSYYEISEFELVIF